MYYYLEGKLSLPAAGFAVIDCGGVGYKLTISGTTRQQIAAKVGQNVRLYTSLSVREDAMELFGFESEKEKDAYELLITVSGVGPKAAVAILSALTVERLQKAILNGETKIISTANGVGAKLAARVVLELKDKISKSLGEDIGELDDISQIGGENEADALEALLMLGYKRGEASAALRKVNAPGKSADVLIAECLKMLSKM